MKNTTKITIAMFFVAIVGIGMPLTFSAGSGQHKFIQAGTVSNGQTDVNAFCMRCHNDVIMQEMASSNKDLYFGNGVSPIHSGLLCSDCHALTNGYGGSYNNGVQKVEHAAKIPSCLKCHNGQIMPDTLRELRSTTEAHRNFTGQKDDISCIGCHTNVVIDGSISYSYSNGETVSGLRIGIN